jgi:hypothetical protein
MAMPPENVFNNKADFKVLLPQTEHGQQTPPTASAAGKSLVWEAPENGNQRPANRL